MVRHVDIGPEGLLHFLSVASGVERAVTQLAGDAKTPTCA